MTENADNLVLEILKRIQQDVGQLKTDVGQVKTDVRNLDARVSNVEIHVASLVKIFGSFEEALYLRLQQHEDRLGRLERPAT